MTHLWQNIATKKVKMNKNKYKLMTLKRNMKREVQMKLKMQLSHFQKG